MSSLTLPGQYYEWTKDGLEPVAPAEPDFVICRRVADYVRLPADAGLSRCAQCDEPIVFDPAGPWLDKPRVCMQCRGIEPLPFETPS